MGRSHIFLLTGVTICIVAMILVVCKIGDTRENQNTFSSTTLGEGISSVEADQLMNRNMPRSAHRQRPPRENLDRLSRLGYVLTADHIEGHTAKGKVKIVAPDGRILRSDSVSISSNGKHILLRGSVSAESGTWSNFKRIHLQKDSSARIALDGSSESFTGSPLYEPGSTFQMVISPNEILTPNEP